MSSYSEAVGELQNRVGLEEHFGYYGAPETLIDEIRFIGVREPM
ncbi:Unknown protein sequence [Pseudomonas syringae pv. solidagae]|nr:Unknown protein sequence [Pseudomonas syringae pv. solidagae]